MERRVEIGWQSTSAAGGGGGMVRVMADPTPFDEAVRVATDERGPPEASGAHHAVWSRHGGGHTDRLELYPPDAPPAHLPLDAPVPPGAGHVRVEVSLYTPGPTAPPLPIAAPPERSSPSRWAVFVFVVLAALIALGTIAAIAWMALLRGGSFC